MPVDVRLCPFCGEDAYPHERSDDDNRSVETWWAIVCGGCEARMEDATREKVVAAWNRREGPSYGP